MESAQPGDPTPEGRPVALVLISQSVDPAKEAAFLDWQREISAAESAYAGFLSHRIEPPIDGIQKDWVISLAFDTPEHLDAWLESPRRTELLARGGEFGQVAHLTRTSYGFGFWSKNADTAPEPVFHANLLVLLVLYPIVFLWGYFIGEPLLERGLGMPFWLALFIGNVVSTQLLGWWFVPWAMRLFRRWLVDLKNWKVQLVGYLVLAALYGLSMWLYAWLMSLQGA